MLLGIMIIIGYLVGSLPAAIIVAKMLNLSDPRGEGSGNAGTTNMLRVHGKKAAIMTLVGDAGKGLAVVLIAKLLTFSGLALGVIGLAVFAGHLYPLFLRFKGGKGVAVLLGVSLGFSFWLGIFAFATWAAVAVLTRYSSLSALVSAALLPFYALYFASSELFFPILVMSVLVFWRHRDNIQRLRNRTEPKIGK